MQDHYRTVARRSRFEPDKIKGSRFIADVAPAGTPDDVEAVLADVRAEFDDARHTCFAWRLGEQTRSSDDGEPAGSAGRPILAQIDGHELQNVVVSVTRYFGGVKLGVGGLIRAYGGAAGMALDRAEIVTVAITARRVLNFPYACSGVVEGLLAAERLEVKRAEYGADVRIEVDVPVRRLEAFEHEFGERTGGRGTLG
ncbi:MAG: DUF1949 domain-containing protein [bacterium]|nr:DUF1949 domain-containing protein [bacterium]